MSSSLLMTWQIVLQQKRKYKKDQVSDSCDSYDFTISIKKTEVVYQPAPGKPYMEPIITVKGQRLQVVGKFTYIGSPLSRVVHIDDDVNARISKASAAFGRLRGSIWDRSGTRLDIKLKVQWNLDNSNSNKSKFLIIQNHFEIPTEIYVCILTLNYSKSQ